MSKTKITYKIVAMFCTVLSVVTLSACADDVYNEGGRETKQATLTLKVQTLAADSQSETVNEEAMHSLRIVILSKSKNGYWTVEYNDCYDFNSIGIRLSDEKEFEVEGELTKRVYLIANEAQVKDLEGNKIDLKPNEMYLPDHRTGIASIDRVSFFPQQADDLVQTGLPMTAVYEFEMGKTSEEKECYIVRTVSKITFSYTNNTIQIPENPKPEEGDVISSKKRKIKLLGWTLENIADQSYLMPYVNTDTEGKYHVVDTERQELLPLEGNWIDWMKKETEKNADTDIARYQWLTDYEVPERATHSVYTHWYSKETTAPDAPVIEPKADGVDETKHTYADAPVVYLPESRNPAWPAKDEEQTKENPWADELKLQQYRLTVITNELDLDENAPLDEKDPANWKAASYTAILPQLCSLFRNTHVKVNITFKGAGQFAIYAEIEPWGYVKEKFEGELVPDTNPPTEN